MKKITSFSDQYHFLSNFYPAQFDYHGYTWKTAEHAYQAMKCVDQEFWYEMAYGDLTAGQAKRIGKTVELREDWDEVKLVAMRSIVTQKFKQNPDLMEKLDQTVGIELVEGNTWGDRFWGQCPVGVGKNHLGKILMSIRDDITRLGVFG